MRSSTERSVLVTGAGGFVGRHLVPALVAEGYTVHALGRSHRPATLPNDVPWLQVDLLDPAMLAERVPRSWWGVIHLAGHTIPSEVNSLDALLQNVGMTIALVEHITDGRFVHVSSCHVYTTSAIAHREDEPLYPKGRYGLSKLLCERAVLASASRLDVRIARPFNHLGPGMHSSLAIPSLLARIQREGNSAVPLRMRGLDSVRDFLDVRDIVRAYMAILALAVPSGITLNVCSGRPVAISAVAREALALTRLSRDVEFAAKPNSLDDTQFLVGDPSKLREATGWAPIHTTTDALQSMIDAERAGVPG